MCKIAISCVFFLVFTALFVSPATCYSEDEARSAIEAAESEILNCYNAAFEAQKAGANINELLSALNEAGWLLSKAKFAYSQEDFDSSVSFANECQSKLEGFLDRANVLKRNAEKEGYLDFMNNFVGSGVGALCVIIGGFAFWTFLKKREEVKESG
jgi:hypothetical protein